MRGRAELRQEERGWDTRSRGAPIGQARTRNLHGREAAVTILACLHSCSFFVNPLLGTDRLWDLTLARLALTTPLPPPPKGGKHSSATLPDRILFSPDGSKYLLLWQHRLEIRDLFPAQGAEGIDTVEPPKYDKFTSATFLPDGNVVTGTESGKLYLPSSLTSSPDADADANNLTIQAHTSRTRLVETLILPHPTKPEDTLTLLISAASNGILHIWTLPLTSSSVPIAKYDTRFRPTCLVAGAVGKRISVPLIQVEARKSKREEKREAWERKMKERGGDAPLKRARDEEEEELELESEEADVGSEDEEEEEDGSEDSESGSESEEQLPPPKKRRRGGPTDNAKRPAGMPQKPGPASKDGGFGKGQQRGNGQGDQNGRGGRGGEQRGGRGARGRGGAKGRISVRR